jgi:HK97 gp10 family phage protein
MSLKLGVDVAFKNHLAKLDKPAAEKMMNTAMVSGALLIANKWKQLAPYETGTYRRSIHVAGHTELTPDFDGEELGEPNNPLVVRIGTKIDEPPYPVYLEYGTSRMPPHPSAQPAFDATRNEAIREVADAFGILLAKAAQ